MTDQDYIAQRIDNQIKWYSSKSLWNKKRYHLIKTVIICISVSIPFLTGLIGDNATVAFWLKILIGIGGIIIATGEGILSLQKYQDNWMEYRQASETLKREKMLYLTKAGPYRSEANLQQLVERIENFTENENKTWMQYIKTDKSPPKKTKPEEKPEKNA